MVHFDEPLARQVGWPVQPTRAAGEFLPTLPDDFLGGGRLRRLWGPCAPDDVRIRDAGGLSMPVSDLITAKLVIQITGLMLCSCVRGPGEPPGMGCVF